MARKIEATAPRQTGDTPVLANESVPQRDVIAVAAAAGDRVAEIRRERLAADLSRWASIVGGIADGADTDATMVAEIAELSARLQLPEGTLSDDVAVVLAGRRLEARLQEKQKGFEAWQAAAPAKRSELEHAQRRVRELEADLQSADRQSLSITSQMSELSKLKERNPRLFAPTDAVARRLLAASPASVWKQFSQTEVIR